MARAKDPARKWTDKELKEMERHIGGIYDQALKEITEKWDAYMERAEKRLGNLYAAYVSAPEDKKADALEKYQKALENATYKNEWYRDMVKETTTRLTKVNEIATAYINGQMPEVYKVNYDQIDPDALIPGIKYTMADEHTVSNLIKNGAIPQKEVDEKKDMSWNTKQIGSAVLQGILQGESIPNIAKRLLPIVDNNKVSAVRNARTMTTAAENRGRLDRYDDYESKGLIMKKVWIATGDSRTRDWHLSLDGQEVDKDESFVDGNGNELQYPGDPDAAPETVWNCRCSMRSHITGVRGKSGKITPIADMHKTGLHQEQIAAEMEKRGLEPAAVVEEKKTATERLKDSLENAYQYHNDNNKLNRTSVEKLKELNMNAVSVNIDKLSEKTQEVFADTLSDLISKYDTPLDKIRLMTYEEYMGASNSYAFVNHDYTTDEAILVLNPRKVSDYDDMLEHLKNSMENGYIAQVKQERLNEYVVTHEFAHTLLDMQTQLSKKNNFVDADYEKIKSVRKEIDNIYNDYINAIGALDEKKTEYELQYFQGGLVDEDLANKAIELEDKIAEIKIGDYSMVDSDEFFAEAFAHDRLGGPQNEYVERVMEIINKNFRR